jgi:hypothetical protein
LLGKVPTAIRPAAISASTRSCTPADLVIRHHGLADNGPSRRPLRNRLLLRLPPAEPGLHLPTPTITVPYIDIHIDNVRSATGELP